MSDVTEASFFIYSGIIAAFYQPITKDSILSKQFCDLCVSGTKTDQCGIGTWAKLNKS